MWVSDRVSIYVHDEARISTHNCVQLGGPLDWHVGCAFAIFCGCQYTNSKMRKVTYIVQRLLGFHDCNATVTRQYVEMFERGL